MAGWLRSTCGASSSSRPARIRRESSMANNVFALRAPAQKIKKSPAVCAGLLVKWKPRRDRRRRVSRACRCRACRPRRRSRTGDRPPYTSVARSRCCQCACATAVFRWRDRGRRDCRPCLPRRAASQRWQAVRPHRRPRRFPDTHGATRSCRSSDRSPSGSSDVRPRRWSACRPGPSSRADRDPSGTRAGSRCSPAYRTDRCRVSRRAAASS